MAKARHLLHRFGLASVLLAFGVWEIVNPNYWTAFVPEFTSNFAPAATLVLFHGIALTVVGAAVFFGIYLQYAAALATLIMLEIIIGLLTSSGFSDILIRDIAIFFLALGLSFDRERFLTLIG